MLPMCGSAGDFNVVGALLAMNGPSAWPHDSHDTEATPQVAHSSRWACDSSPDLEGCNGIKTTHHPTF